MAEQKQAPDQENSRAAEAGGGFGLVGAVLTGAAAAVGKLWNAVTADGYLAAAGRQGADELGAALKAFPDSIQVQEPGTLWNPTQGEIAADRAEGIGRPLWPSEIAEANRIAPPGNSNGNDQGRDAGYSM